MDTKTLCLGALTLGDASGYDMRKRFEERFGCFLDVSPSAIYPALADLHRDGLVTVTCVAQETRPDKKVYRLTERGREALVEALIREPARHRVRSEFMILLSFSHLLPRWRLEQVIEERIAEFERMVEGTRSWLEQEGAAAPAGMQFAAGYGLTVLQTACAYLRDHRGQLVEGAGPEAAERPPAALAAR
jgi:PadR family transcriptional regulator, regulatory protein AphA